ncbi:MAG: hydrogenase maturation protease [Victivallales bacterium]|nr:hydrogenase maturation protease [Victivallales bacterium]
MNRYIIGFGNYARQDDGIGLRIVEHIVDRGLEDGFTAIEAGNDGLSILPYFAEDTERILIIDCGFIDLNPGECKLFDVNEVASRKETTGITTHEGDVVKLVELAEKLGYPIPPLRILAIQPDSMEMDSTLSDALLANFNRYVELAIAEIKK